MECAFGTSDDLNDELQLANDSEGSSARSSMYVDLFEGVINGFCVDARLICNLEMLDTVLRFEDFLFSPTETLYFQKFRSFSGVNLIVL